MEFDEQATDGDHWEDEDNDWQDEFDGSENEADQYVDCPVCGADVYELAEQCPACGSYITHSTSAFSGKPWWWVTLGLIGILALAAALLF